MLLPLVFQRLIEISYGGSGDWTKPEVIIAVTGLIFSLIAILIAVAGVVVGWIQHKKRQQFDERAEIRRQRLDFFNGIFLGPNLQHLSGFFGAYEQSLARIDQDNPSILIRERVNNEILGAYDLAKKELIDLLSAFDRNLQRDVDREIQILVDTATVALLEKDEIDYGLEMRAQLKQASREVYAEVMGIFFKFDPTQE